VAKTILNIIFLFSFIGSPSFPQGSLKSIDIVSDDNYPPYIFRNDNGELQGITIDEWKLWELKTGIHANIIAMDWGKAYSYMLEGKADVLETVFFNDERSKIFEFTKPYAEIDVPVFFNNTLSGITDIRTIRGFTIGVKSGDACIDIFRANGIETLKEYSNYEAIIKAAANGDIRVFCIDKPPALYYLYKNNLENQFNYSFTLYHGEFHRAVKKGQTELLKIIEDGFASISKDEKDRIEKKWMGTTLPQQGYIRYIIYSLLLVSLIALMLFLINLFLRRNVKEKTYQLEKAFTELSKSEDKYRNIFENANEGICVTNKSGNITAFNPKFAEMLGYSDSEIASKNFNMFILDEDLNDFNLRQLERLDGKQEDYERRLRRKDGSIIWTIISASPISDSKGGYNGSFGMYTDSTRRKQMELELIAAKEKAEKSDKLKSEFLAQISHEIRSPLHVILSFTGLVKTDLKDKINPDMMEYFTFIESAGNRLIRTVDLVLNASEMQLGTYEPTFVEFDLVKEIVSKLSSEYKKLVEDKGLEFHYSSNISEVIIRGDSYSIYQIFVNLIENAIKYTKEGYITLAIESDANSITKVSVEDTGIGMSEEFLNNLFEPFMQEERGYSRRFEGNGLGLSLVKKYCDMNSISITAESQKDRGSKFIVTFNQIKKKTA